MSSAQLPPPTVPNATFVWLYLRFDGRISRQVYWLSIGFLWAVLFVAVGLLVEFLGEEEAAAPSILLGVAALWCEMAVLVKRQHDRGLPWYWCLLAFVPIVGVVWMVAAGIIEGDSGSNAFGPHTDAPPA